MITEFSNVEVDCDLEKRKFYGEMGAKVVLRESENRRIGDTITRGFATKGSKVMGQ